MNNELSAKNIVVAGLGLTGQSCIRYLLACNANVRCWDTRESMVIPDDLCLPVTLGTLGQDYFADTDLLVLSPGIDPKIAGVQLAIESGVPVIGDIELFAQANTRPVVGITGSNGKTTVTLLVTHILQSLGVNAQAGGNVGKPALDLLNSDAEVIVLELSSFQLEATNAIALQGATILNVSDDHLDRHGNMQQYTATKQRIYRKANTAVYNRDDPATLPSSSAPNMTSIGLSHSATGWSWESLSGDIIFDGQPVLSMADCKLVGSHNVLNIQAALALVSALGYSVTQAAKAVMTFNPAPHRCSLLSTVNGVLFIDDSKATNVGATIAALQGLRAKEGGRLILIAGGDGKGADLTALASALQTYVYAVIAIGRDGKKIASLHSNSQYVDSMLDAVKAAWQLAKPNDVILLSPACASLDMFENYQHRAEVFASCIAQVAV